MRARGLQGMQGKARVNLKLGWGGVVLEHRSPLGKWWSLDSSALSPNACLLCDVDRCYLA